MAGLTVSQRPVAGDFLTAEGKEAAEACVTSGFEHRGELEGTDILEFVIVMEVM
jgi:hypothetical protein